MNNLIEKAVKMIDSHDWYWMMCDYGYNQNLKNAENEKNQFVSLLNTINDVEICNILKSIWISNYNLACAFRNGRQTSTYKNQIENLTNELNTITYKN